MGDVRIPPDGIRDNPPPVPKPKRNYREVKVAEYADRLAQLERFYAANRDQAREYCKGRPCTPIALSTVLGVLVRRTDGDTGKVSQTLAQLAAGSLELSTAQVRRALTALRELGWVETLAKPVSPGRNGGQGKPTVSRVTFLQARTEPKVVNSDPPTDPVDNPGMTAHLSAHPFPDKTPGMTAQKSGNDCAPICAPLRFRTTVPETVCGETLIGTPSTPATDHQSNSEPSRWVIDLLAIARNRPGLTNRARADLRAYAAGMESEYGHLRIRDHGSHLADYLIAKTREERLDPALLDYLAHAATTEALEGRCGLVTVAAGGAR